MNMTCNDSTLFMTSPYLMPTKIQTMLEEQLFEKYQFHGVSLLPVAEMIVHNRKTSAQLVVDSGFSFTHVVPILSGKTSSHLKRLDIGGKFLTNYLMDIISHRQWNMMDEYLLINDVKEALCFTSLNFKQDVSTVSRLYDPVATKRKCSIRQEWILPDYTTHHKGYIATPEDLLNEGAQVPSSFKTHSG